MSDGWAPSAAGAPCSARSTHPPVASVSVPAASRNASRNMRSGSPELRWPLLHTGHLRFDDILTGPRLVEKLLLDRRGLFDGTVVVQYPLGVLQRQRRQARDLGGPGLRIGQRADP